jgi:hypothetical protein
VVAPPAVVAPPPAPAPAVTSEAPRQHAPESPVTESQATVTIPVTTTLVEPPPKQRGGGE